MVASSVGISKVSMELGRSGQGVDGLDSPGSPPIDDKLEHSVPIRNFERLAVQARTIPLLGDDIAGIPDGRPDVRVEHGKVELKVIDLDGSIARGVVQKGVMLRQGDLVRL